MHASELSYIKESQVCPSNCPQVLVYD